MTEYARWGQLDENRGATFQAKYDGNCGSCDEEFSAGDDVHFCNGILHANNCCGELKPVTPEPARRAVCAVCFTEQSASGNCGCS